MTAALIDKHGLVNNGHATFTVWAERDGWSWVQRVGSPAYLREGPLTFRTADLFPGRAPDECAA